MAKVKAAEVDMAAKRKPQLKRGAVVVLPGSRKGIVLGAKSDKRLYVCTIISPKFSPSRKNAPMMTGVSLRSSLELRAVGTAKKVPWQCLSHLRDFKRFEKMAGG